jgi:predicted permease
MLETVWRDIRHGALMLVRNPGFAAIAMLSIAVGVGANAAMFSVADGLLLRPLPVASPGRILTIMATFTGTDFRDPSLSAAEYVDIRDRARSFDGVVAYTIAPASFAVTREQTAQRKVGMAVSSNLFDAMGVRPAYGRVFRADEDQAGRPVPVVVLDHDEWIRSFASNAGVVGSTIRISGMDFTVIGVAPRRFNGIDHNVHPAFYVPLAALTSVLPGLPPDILTTREDTARRLVVKARLKPGLTVEQARADVAQIAANLRQAYPDTNQDRHFIARTQLEAITYARSDAPMIIMLMVIALGVLIVACANVAGLLASRAPARARDIAMRLAIGAGRAQVVRRLMIEGLLLAVGGTIVGLGLAYAAIGVFQRIDFPTDVPLKITFALNLRAFTVGVAAAVACALLASLIPAWIASRSDLVHVFKGDGSSRLSRQWGRQFLVGGQIAIALVLLTIGVFLYRAFAFELDRGPGFRTDHLLMAVFEPSLARYDGDRARRFYREVKERTLALPGVRSAAWTSSVLMKAGDFEQMIVAPEGFQFAPGTQNVPVLSLQTDEHYFDAMGVPIVRGRAFRDTDDEGAPLVAIVNETMARRYWPGQDVVGKRLRLDSRDGAWAEIVGVARDSKNVFIAIDPVEMLMVPHLQHPHDGLTLLVHTAGPSESVAAPLLDVVHSLDADMPVFGVRTMEDFYYWRATNVARLLSGSVAVMGAMGVTLAVVGLYGLVAHLASRRTREIGIRMAIGAQPRAVLRMVLGYGLVLSICGLAAGAAGSLAIGRLLPAVLNGLDAIEGGVDVVTMLIVVSLLVSVTLLATYLPARRAARIDPLIALRQD